MKKMAAILLLDQPRVAIIGLGYVGPAPNRWQ